MAVRARGEVPIGDFDLRHLRAIHRYLFQDVYDWAGDIRTVNISKGSSAFQAFVFIETGVAHVHSSVRKAKYLKNLSPAAFAKEAAAVLSDLNYCHPFREGNGRTQIVYLRQLAERAGHTFRPERLGAAGWIAASQSAMGGDNAPFERGIFNAVVLKHKTL